MNRRLDTMAGRTGTRVARVIPPWAAAVLGTWVLGTVVLGIIAQRGLDGSLVAMVSHSAARSFLVCVAVGGPATFTALALR